ncbi:MAG: MgtC/SapB family protein [Hungatella sp.]
MIETLNELRNYLGQVNLISILLRIFIAMACGGIIGLERGKAQQAAGMRTHMLVSLGAAMVMLTGQFMYLHFNTGDPTRLGAQVVSGIGFLGAGSIMVSGDAKVRGLTTAAGLWTAACIGLTIGIGFYSAGILATILVYLIMARMKKIEYKVMMDDIWYGLYFEIDDMKTLSFIADKLSYAGIQLGDVQVQEGKNGQSYKIVIPVLKSKKEDRDTIIQRVENVDGVHFAKYIY